MAVDRAGRATAVLLGVTLLHSLHLAWARTDVEIFEMLIKDYKPEEAPDRFGSRSGYIEVAVRAMLESITVDEKGSAATLQYLQRLTWSDVRLRYRSAPAAGGLVISHAAAGLPNSPKIWLPSLVYPGALLVDFDNSMDNSFLIRPNGTTTWQRRVHLMVPCEIQLDSFPWDENTCRASIRQDLDAEVLRLKWTRVAGRPVQAGPHFSVPGFQLSSLGVSSSRGAAPGDATGESLRYKSLILRVTFKRQSDYYLVNDIVPTSILILASYVTFWLSPEVVLVRSLVASFMLLACFLVSATAARAAPLSAALSALNVWNLVCQVLLLWSLLQALAVFQLHRKGRPAGSGAVSSAELAEPLPKPPALNGSSESDPEAVTTDALPPPPADELGPLPPRPSRRRRAPGLSPHMADVISRVLYPLAFITTAIAFAVLYS